ncbi:MULTISPECIES: type II toxin-antitoxin system VapC family toxin [unclassified Neorhizobium]|uniref:type II toxin-antitoxin system VapC family toxin n=1 Tax=unclassified Neorhizobium TaxID=2629175 RepID=UPI001FF1DAA6|nr:MULTISPECIES: type II toxin-antitoxin system VapC family toxin [unclassified Neorhizobium]MCJ9674110.1 type II toxin-antitoxin system VapC family toxin [Neorhizobium sp. SHOUNA12B]MCJ9748177.1 type II toxin-antitoxin system VapC family toxin [Neorhizobium sp. SHOUNA12A]
MRYLLDTHALLWWLNDHPDLSSAARELIIDEKNDIYVSVASAWEIATKHKKGKLPTAISVLPNFSEVVQENGFADLPITSAHMVRSVLLPGIHQDPFDRILAAQAIIEDMALISIDEKMAPLGVITRW